PTLSRLPFAILQYGQYVFENTTTLSLRKYQMESILSLLQNNKELDNVELMSEIALFAYLSDNAYGKNALKLVTGAKVIQELYRRFTKQDQIIEALRADAVRKIALYVEKNPRASTNDQAREIQKHVDDFAAKVALVNGA
uniref:Uncharacterized protein n=2 Tax=Clytia hemisphaerica TaxID=252671 RepID=A0A7M5X8C7_9CNID